MGQTLNKSKNFHSNRKSANLIENVELKASGNDGNGAADENGLLQKSQHSEAQD